MLRPVIHPRTLLATLLATALVTACVDAPYTPEDGAIAGPMVFAPSLALVGPGGAPVASEGQADALTEAFDRVNRFRIVVRRARDNSIVVDEIISVTPGQAQYDLAVSVTPSSPDEQFLVTLTALEGEIELFSSPPIAMKAVPENSTSGSAPAQPVNVTLEYSGPGATAAAVEMAPATLVLGPGGSGSLTATVLDEDGGALADVPVSWSTGNESVATVTGGAVTGAGDGVTNVTVTTPTGLQASARIYVVSGTLAYVEDGTVMTREAVGTEAQARSGGGGASAPAWSPDGGQLYYAAGGSARRAGSDEAIVEGDWPSVSPSATYLAVERGGQVVFANVDGSLERGGPAGTTPVWADEGTVVVGGGSIQQVDVAGGGRSTVVSGDASLPALGPGGALAYVSDGNLMVQGRDAPVASGASGRPSWSSGGMWLAFQGGEGIMVVPADGSAPPAALPGLGAASDPAWQPSSPLGAPATPFLSGLNPDPPVPGQSVDLLGGGFDRVIPANNQVFWPTPDGSEETTVTGATSGTLTTTMPNRVTAGQIRVENRGGSAVMDFVPSLGALEVLAHTPWDAGVPGVGITLLDGDGQEVARGETDSEGMLLLSALRPGTYTVLVAPPNTHAFNGARSRTLEIGTETLSLDLVLSPLVASVVPDPEDPILAVGESLAIGITAYDAAGNVIPQADGARWGGASGHVAAGGSGLRGTITGVAPSQRGEGEYYVSFSGKVFVLGATVTSNIGGTISKTDGETTGPARGYPISVELDGSEIAAAFTDAAGRYRFDGLTAGEYVVRPGEPQTGSISPQTRTVTLGLSNKQGQADFAYSSVPVSYGSGEVLILGDINFWGSGSYILSANNREMTRNFVTNGSRTRSIWYFGHNTYNYNSYNENYFSQSAAYIRNDVGHTLDIVDNMSTGTLSIPSDVASIWFWMPQAVFNASDIAAIQAYVAGGGRAIFVGENNGSGFNTTNQRVQEVMNALGSAGVYTDGCLSGVANDVTPDPLTQDVVSIQARCSSYVTLGAGDTSLIRYGGSSILTRIRLGAPVTAPARAALVATPEQPALGAEALDPTADPSVGPGERQRRR